MAEKKPSLEDNAECDVTNFDNYVTQAILGEGAYGKVYRVLFKPTNQSLALKIFKPNSNLQRLYEKEVESLKLVKNRKEFVQIFAQLDQFRQKYKGIAMEFCPGGELLKYIMVKKGLGEQDVRTYLHQIVAILEALQEKRLAHLDIKAENFFLDADFNLILGDFGMSEILTQPNQIINDFNRGSPSYLLLEQLQQRPYQAAHADLFAAAVTLFSIYSCLLPFKQPQQYSILFNNPAAFWKVVRQNSPNPAFQDSLNKDFVNLFMLMVHPHPNKRITLEEIKQHPFYLGEQGIELQQALHQSMAQINSNQNTFNAPQNQSNQPDQNSHLTRGVEAASIREQFEMFEGSVSNLLKSRQPKAYDLKHGRLSDFKTNIDCQTLFEYLFVNQELFTSEMPVLSEKSYKLKCIHKVIEVQEALDETSTVQSQTQGFEEFIPLEIKLEGDKAVVTTEEIKFDIVLKTDPDQKHTYVDFVRKSGNAFNFFEIVAKIQNLICEFN